MAGILTAARGLLSDLLDFCYPPVCLICGRYHDTQELVCKRCGAQFTRLPDPVCLRCRSFIPDPHLRCLRGHRLRPAPVWALGLFDDYYREVIHAFKFHNRLDAGQFLGLRLADMLTADPRARHIQAVAPVPLHPTRLRERGFNQSEMLARLIALKLNVPVEAHMLHRIRNTPTQTALDYESRRKNVAGAFLIGDKSVAGVNVLLIDDVSTTGATISECASVLREAGAGAIFGAVVALAALDA